MSCGVLTLLLALLTALPYHACKKLEADKERNLH